MTRLSTYAIDQLIDSFCLTTLVKQSERRLSEKELEEEFINLVADYRGDLRIVRRLEQN